jgi:LEA14-like dessication related protein
MEIIRVLLVLTSLGITLGPIAAGIIIYRDNLTALIVPENQNLMAESPKIEYVDARYDAAAKEVLFRFNVTNPYNITITLDSLSADLQCSDHQVPLGSISVSDAAKTVPAESSALIEIIATYTPQGENHVETSHAGQTSIYVDVVNLTIDVQGINVQYQGRIDHVGPVPVT